MADQLCSFDRGQRLAELRRLAFAMCTPEIEAVNTHYHTFYSFNAEGWSPCKIAYEAKKAGLAVAGTVDFDVLDALEEFAQAAQILRLRAISAVETRTFVKDMASVEINSPGEPGVAYFMATGFAALPEAGSDAAAFLAEMRKGAEERNRTMLSRLQSALAALGLDYDKDILPLTPGGNATERHMLAAIDEKSRQVFADPQKLAEYWAGILGMTAEAAAGLLADTPKFRNAIRAKLMKKGGPGYVPPGPDTFPAVEKVVQLARSCGALACWAWLDGTSAGEADAVKLCAYAKSIGCEAFSIIPDRNWNIADPVAKAKKVANFDAVVKAAADQGLLFTVGTEMNNYGLPFVDNFEVPEMRKHAALFLRDALALYGHTLMQRACKKGIGSDWCAQEFGADYHSRNAFYAEVGRSGKIPASLL